MESHSLVSHRLGLTASSPSGCDCPFHHLRLIGKHLSWLVFKLPRFPPHTRKYSVEVGCGIHAFGRVGFWWTVKTEEIVTFQAMLAFGQSACGSASKAPITHPIKDESSSSDWQTQTFYVQQRILFILEMFSVPILFNMYGTPFTFLSSNFPLTSSRDFHTANITTPCTFNLIAIFVSFFFEVLVIFWTFLLIGVVFQTATSAKRILRLLQSLSPST